MEQGMGQPVALIRQLLKTPRAAAIAGIHFSILLATILVLLRISVQAASQETRAWLKVGADIQGFYQDRHTLKRNGR